MSVTDRLFVDREAEIWALMKAWEKRPWFVVIYGRQRTSKTRLVAEWLRRLSIVPRSTIRLSRLSMR